MEERGRSVLCGVILVKEVCGLDAFNPRKGGRNNEDLGGQMN